MNYKYIFNIIGKILGVEAALMLLPALVGLIDGEGFTSLTVLSFLFTAAILALVAVGLNIVKAKNHKIMPKGSFIIVAFSWILMSLFGCLPFVISGEIPNFFDAFFEMCSGFTTTGASILTEIEHLNHSTLFWRSFSHWIGGMGVVVFILAILPDSKEGSTMHILKAESPGPQVGKLVSKMGANARILYIIYLVLTVLEFLLLLVGRDPKFSGDPKENVFACLTTAFATAGTGGFSIYNDSIASFSPYSQYVIAVFMILFGTNFSIFYLILIKKFKNIFKNEELRFYYAVVASSTIFICLTLFFTYKSQNITFEKSFRDAFFQVASIISTTGFSTVDYSSWPTTTLCILIFLTFTGACAGSTGGGMKLTRISILAKAAIREVKHIVHPGKIEIIRDSGSQLDEDVIKGAESFAILYFSLLAIVTLLISFDGADILTNFTAALSCISNVGPGLGKVGPAGNFAFYSSFSKFVLSLLMIAGRLELFPMIALFNPRTWSAR